MYFHIPVFYINLDTRTDRKENFIKQCNNLGFCNLTRVSGIVNRFGALGCSQAHIQALKLGIKSGKQFFMIAEDDFYVPDEKRFHHLLLHFLRLNMVWDMFLMSAFVQRSFFIDDTIVRVLEAQTTGCFLVHKNFARKLLQNFETGARLLSSVKEKERHRFCIDQYWKRLQPISRWFCCFPELAQQQEGFSDIELKVVNYANSHKSCISINEPIKNIHFVEDGHTRQPSVPSHEKVVFIIFNPNMKKSFRFHVESSRNVVLTLQNRYSATIAVGQFLNIWKVFFKNLEGHSIKLQKQAIILQDTPGGHSLLPATLQCRLA